MPIHRRTLALSLALTTGIGAKTITRIFTRNDLIKRTPDEFFELSEDVLKEEYRFNSKIASHWIKSRKTLFEQAVVYQEKFDQMGVHMITAVDAHYPRSIEQMNPNPPGVLFLHGNIKLLETKLFAIMSSRKSSPAAFRQIEKLSEEGVHHGEVLVCGHSTPEYQQAAVVPLRWGAPRIIVLDRGLYSALGEDLSQELFSTARLWRYEFDPNVDLVISAVNPMSSYYASCNKTRDFLVGSLANRIDFVLINPNGNMEQIAIHAYQSGKKIRVSGLNHPHESYQQNGIEILNIDKITDNN